MKTKELILQSERNRKRLIEIIYKTKAIDKIKDNY